MSEPASIAATGDVIHESKITPRQWAILSLCFLAYLLDGFDIVVIAFTAPAISQDWGIPSSELGLVFSSGMLGMTLGAMFLASLADLYGRRAIVFATLLVAGVTTWLIGYASSVAELIVLRLIAGLGLGTLVATLAPLAGEYSPSRYRTLIMGIIFAGGSAGPVVGGLISAALIAEYGWRALFQGAGLITILVGILIYIVVPESIAFIIKRRPDGALERVNRILATIGQSQLERLPPSRAGAAQESASVVSLLVPSRRAMTLLIWIGFFLGFATVYFLTSWVPQLLVDAGLPQEQAILGAVIIAFGSILGTTLFGWMARWWSLNRLIAAGFVIGAIGMVAVAGLLQDLDPGAMTLVWGLLFVIGVSLMGAFSNLYTVALTIYPAQVRSTGLGWAAGLGRSGAVVSPAAAGMLIAAGVAAPALFLLFAIPILAAAGCVFLIRFREME
jgi:AAHS family 4-hydroxybenzoate transporter-like MFS transporter